MNWLLDLILDALASIPGGRPRGNPIRQAINTILFLLVVAAIFAVFVWWRNR